MPGWVSERPELHGTRCRALGTCQKSPDGRSHDRRHFFFGWGGGGVRGGIKWAFDTVWHAKLLDKRQALGITGRMHQFVQTFLDSRQMAVKVGHTKSHTHTLDMGVPQGSVIAPTLFSLMLDDIKTVGSPRLSRSLHAGHLWGMHCQEPQAGMDGKIPRVH